MRNIALLMAAVSGLGLAAAQAQDAPVLPDIADTDSSGAWSLAELQAVWADLTEETFATVDVNADGSVDQAELTAALEGGKLAVPAE